MGVAHRDHLDSWENDTRHDPRLSGSCSYLSWLHVTMYSDGQKLQRCAYMYGTRANSWTSYSKSSKMLQSAPIGDDVSVWVMQNDPKLCVVGVHPLEELVNQEILAILYLSWPLIPLWVVLSFRSIVGGGGRSDGYVLVQKEIP